MTVVAVSKMRPTSLVVLTQIKLAKKPVEKLWHFVRDVLRRASGREGWRRRGRWMTQYKRSQYDWMELSTREGF